MRNWGASLPNEKEAGGRIGFLTLDEVLAIHERLIERFGGSAGVRDHGLLESALFRPQTGYYEDLAETAAALLESLLMNHPFVDGNKRVAFFSTDVFLALNGWKLEVDDREAHAHLIRLLEENRISLEELTVWIRSNVKRKSQPIRSTARTASRSSSDSTISSARFAASAARTR